MELIPLGTSSATLVKERGLSAHVLRCDGSILLFDCGDGTQFRLKKAGIRHSRVKVILISHLHGDHLLGLFGLLFSMSLARRDTSLTIVGPEELTSIVDAIPGLGSSALSFQIHYVKLKEGFEHEEVYRENQLCVSARPLDHGAFCIGYRVTKNRRKSKIDVERARMLGINKSEQFRSLAKGEVVLTAGGRVITPEQVEDASSSQAVFAYVTDTRPCAGALELAKEASLLLHEATFSQEHAARAWSTGHTTAGGAASVAIDAGVKKLLLTHFSSRYSDLSVLEEEARMIFPNTAIAREYNVYDIMSVDAKQEAGIAR
jgi:ribonuclease Z